MAKITGVYQSGWCANFDGRERKCMVQDKITTYGYDRIYCPGRQHCEYFTFVSGKAIEEQSLEGLRHSWFLRLNKETNGSFWDTCLAVAHAFLVEDHSFGTVGAGFVDRSIVTREELIDCVIWLGQEILAKLTTEQLRNELKIREQKEKE